jgi:alkyl sulfatase BDS1-like metallo-beta-lactamase superfamily hydrolase
MRKGLKVWKSVGCACLVVLAVVPSMAPSASAQTVDNRKDATSATQTANGDLLEDLEALFADKQDFTDANRGLLLEPASVTIPSLDNPGYTAWSLEDFKNFIDYKNSDAAAPSTINPSLYRNAQLNMIHGLFQVKGPIYQVRGYDLSNITFVRSGAGWIVFDPLISFETARAALELINGSGKIPGLTEAEKKVAAVVYSHSHADHYGGVRGLCYDADFNRCNIRVIAPEGFTEHAVSENVIAGNAMSRRALYMYGALLNKDAKGLVNGGLGQTNSVGRSTLVLPTDVIKATGEKRTIGTVTMEFQMTPGTEAPAEMNTWFSDKDLLAMWMAENTTNTFHNVLTLRGAQVRDPLQWAKYLDETILKYGPTVDVKFQSHHWPVWGNAKIIDYWKKQRDLYKYTHDQTVNLMNKGLTGEEISEEIRFPEALDKYWPNRGYYGTLRHNSRAVYQRYMGWYDGNPSNLNNLPPVDAARKYVEYIGGKGFSLTAQIDKVVLLARTDFDNGQYRWVAEVLKHAVFADPNHVAAKERLPDGCQGAA